MSAGLIVFVHGLGGDAQTTWGAFPKLIEDDSDLKNYDVHFFSYPTSLFSWFGLKKLPGIQTLSEALRAEIENRFQHRSDIILVCHSLGGLIGRKYLLEEVKQKRTLRIQGLLLYAVPNTGAAVASVAKEISWRHDQLKQLCKNADLIRDLSEDWVTFKVNEAIRVRYVIAALDRAVDEQSARLFWGNPDIDTVGDRGHRDLVKPKTKDDLPFLILKKFVSSFAQQTDPKPEIALRKYRTGLARQGSSRSASRSRFRIVGFDADATLLRGEKEADFEFSWTLVWRHLDVPDSVWKEARRKYLRSKGTFKDYQEWCEHNFRHLRQAGLRREHFAAITKPLHLTKNLSKTLKILRDEGFILAIISGGIDTFIDLMIPEANKLFDYICINRLQYDDQGIISGIDATPFDFEGKAVALEAICKEHGVSLAEAVFVGEGHNDEAVAKKAGLSIAYPPRGEVISAVSRVEVAEDDLEKILDHVL
jgi:phosphoserine phosphatase